MKPTLLALLLATLFAPLAFGQTTLSIAITESSSGEYDDDVNQAILAGAQATSLSLFWDEADHNGEYAPDFDWPSIANAYYPSKDIGVILALPVIDTVADRRPADLQNLPWDDPLVIARFESYVGEVLGRLSDTNLVAISIGNEIDGHLTRNADWQAFERFFIAARDIVHRLRPDATVGFTMTWQGMQGANAGHAASLNTHTDAVFINYYPLDSGFYVLPPADIAPQLDAMITVAAGKPVYLLETGYPSEGCGSSDAMQLAYFQALFTAWDVRQIEIPLINLVWLHEISRDAANGYGGYYGVNSRCFLDYLGTLGLRSLDGHNKPAFDWLAAR